jgi:hypothetical protein
MRLEAVSAENSWSDQMLTTGCFKRGKPIVDPVSREVMGYEMEMVAHPSDSRPMKCK